MRIRRRPRRPIYFDFHMPRVPRRLKVLVVVLVILTLLAVYTVQASAYLRELTRAMAISDANDLMVLCINDTVADMMRESDFSYDYFVSIEKDEAGSVAAIATNMSRINALSAQLLKDIVEVSDSRVLDLGIPIGNLAGSSLLLGRGPEVPVDVTMLTSSRIDMSNEFIYAGINQTMHQIKLYIYIDLDVILPWETDTLQVVSEVLIAETVIVGKVPDTYLTLE